MSDRERSEAERETELSPEAKAELRAFAKHLDCHPRTLPVEGCRFCDERIAKDKPWVVSDFDGR